MGKHPPRCAQRAPAFLENPPNVPSQEKAIKWRLGASLSVLTKQRCRTFCRRGLRHPTALLWWWSSFLCFLWRTLLTRDFPPPEKQKHILCYSSFPLEFFNSRCATAARESLKSPLLSHHRDRERHVGLKSLSRDSWTWTWLPLCLFWMKAKSWSVLTKLVLQEREFKSKHVWLQDSAGFSVWSLVCLFIPVLL